MTAEPTLFYTVRDRLEPFPQYVAASGPDDARQDDWWQRLVLQAISALPVGEVFQLFDVVERYGLPEPTSSAQHGAVMGRARKEGLVDRVGAEPSRRPSTHGALTRTWRRRATS